MLVSDVFLNVPVTGGEDWSVACLAEQQDAEEKGERGAKGFAARMFDSLVRLMAGRQGYGVCGNECRETYLQAGKRAGRTRKMYVETAAL